MAARDLRMPRYFTGQPFVERRPVNPPAAAYLEAGELAPLYQSIDGSRMHPQYIGNLGDGEDTPEFPMLNRTPFQRLTDLRSRDLDLPRSLGVVNRTSPNSDACRPE
jgi:hypothetical protein